MCKATGKGKKFVRDVHGGGGTGTATASRPCRLRLVKGGKVLATSRTFLHGSHASVTLSAQGAGAGGLHAAHRDLQPGWGERCDQTVKLG